MHRLVMLFMAIALPGLQPAAAAEESIEDSVYPGVVALARSPSGEWGYKSFPHLLPLYVFKGEPAGRSSCDRDCSAVWPIIQAQPGDEPVGRWTIVERDDGRLQWAYEGSPVYTYFEDRPNEPKGAGKRMDWYLERDAYTYLTSVGVAVSPPAQAQADKAGKDPFVAELLKP